MLRFAVFIALAFAAQTGAQDAETYPAEDFSEDTAFPIGKVVDGDTVVIRLADEHVPVRLIGVDTPETMHPQRPAEAFGQEASAFARNLLLGESVYVRGDERDRHGRLLAYLYRAPDGLFVNLEIVRQGYGRTLTDFPFQHMELFQHYQRQAEEAKRGLWGQPAEEPDDPEGAVMVYSTRTGKKYHREGCRWLSKSKIPLSLTEAKKRYSPCFICQPPE